MIEASAGTGKTHQITELVLEHVVDRGVPIDRILVVTFTKAATAELRDRIRRRLAEASTGDDERAERARQAVTSFDLATITTIHGFCHQALATLGLLDDVAGESISTDDGDLRSEIANDAVLREVAARSSSSPLIELFAPSAGDPIANETELRLIVRLMLTHITADVRTVGGTGNVKSVADDLQESWRQLLLAVRDRVLQRRTELGILTYDDVIRRARDAVAGESRHALALRERYEVVMIDEFQDTDALQWEMFTAAFLASGAAPVEMVVVGDPKQAIYAFRGADVHAYLAARVRAGHTRTLEHSWRMERGLIAAVNLLFSGAEFGEPSIQHHDLSAPPELAVGETMTGDPLGAPLSVRVIEPTELKSKPAASYVKADLGRRLVADDVAGVVRELLAADVIITAPSGEARRLQPSDIAVLVNRHNEAGLVAASLNQQGLRCVQRGNASVAISPAAEQWRWLFHAMDRPSSPAAASLAALSWFIGWTPQELADAGDSRLVTVQERLAAWRRLLADAGIAALLAAIRSTTGITGRLLARADGERSVTDLEHLAELLHTAVPGGTTPAALSDALDALDPDDEQAAEHAARRIDSDDDAVQVLTIHTSKGLEFPVTLVPYLWTGRAESGRMLHDDGTLVLDATIGTRSAALERLGRDESVGGDQRVLYVALTRARHRTVVWWGNANGAPQRPLTDVLLRRSVDASCVDTTNDSPKGDTAEVMRRLGGRRPRQRWHHLRHACRADAPLRPVDPRRTGRARRERVLPPPRPLVAPAFVLGHRRPRQVGRSRCRSSPCRRRARHRRPPRRRAGAGQRRRRRHRPTCTAGRAGHRRHRFRHRVPLVARDDRLRRRRSGRRDRAQPRPRLAVEGAPRPPGHVDRGRRQRAHLAHRAAVRRHAAGPAPSGRSARRAHLRVADGNVRTGPGGARHRRADARSSSRRRPVPRLRAASAERRVRRPPRRVPDRLDRPRRSGPRRGWRHSVRDLRLQVEPLGRRPPVDRRSTPTTPTGSRRR